MPKPTGNPTTDTQTYIDLIKDKEWDAAKEFIKEAAKQYTQGGDSGSFLDDLDQAWKSANNAALKKALQGALEQAAGDALDAAASELGGQVNSSAAGLGALGSAPCVRYLTELSEAIQAAKRGETSGCGALGFNDNNNASQCYNKILGSQALGMAEGFQALAEKAPYLCDALGAKCPKKKIPPGRK